MSMYATMSLADFLDADYNNNYASLPPISCRIDPSLGASPSCAQQIINMLLALRPLSALSLSAPTITMQYSMLVMYSDLIMSSYAIFKHLIKVGIKIFLPARSIAPI